MCAVSENILNLKEIYSNRSHYHQWVNNLGEVFLPGFGDSSVLKGTDLLPELPAMALSAVNFDSGFSETVMTIEGETGVAVHVLYDYKNEKSGDHARLLVLQTEALRLPFPVERATSDPTPI